jgi:single-strand DNA-binding protein
MARSINQVILMGRLTRDPETRTTTTGKTVTSFSLAVDRQTQDDQADFFDVTAWEKTGELVQQYLTKGRRCLGTTKILAKSVAKSKSSQTT